MSVLRAVCFVLRAVVIALMAFTPTLLAQPLTATLLVEVVDSTGAALPGVGLSVVHPAAGVERVATTGATGMAVVSLLQPGDYTVRATLAGFRQTSIESFHLEAGAKRSFTIILGPGMSPRP